MAYSFENVMVGCRRPMSLVNKQYLTLHTISFSHYGATSFLNSFFILSSVFLSPWSSIAHLPITDLLQ